MDIFLDFFLPNQENMLKQALFTASIYYKANKLVTKIREKLAL